MIMKSMRKFSFIAIALAALSCASMKPRYGPVEALKDWQGITYNYYGYSEVPLDSTSYQVTFTGSSADGNDRFSLYRAAELTDSCGFDYFIVTNPRISDASAIKTIRMYKGQTPQDPNAYNEKSLLAVMGPNISTK
jgi:hypothetical protein